MLRWKRRSQASIVPARTTTETGVSEGKPCQGGTGAPHPAPSPSAQRKPSTSMTYKYTLFLESVKEELQCSICLEQFCQPRMLSCGHSFCTDCLRSIQHAATIRCPSCRTFTKFPNPGDPKIEDLPTNYAVSNVLDVLVQGSKREILPCPRHAQEQVKFYCVPCDQLLCTECIVAATVQKATMCKDDVQKTTGGSTSQLYGTQRKASLTAVEVDHFYHQLVPLREAVEDLYRQLQAQVPQARKTMAALDQTTSALHHQQQHLQRNAKYLEATISEQFDRWKMVVEQRKQELLAEIQAMRDAKETEVAAQLDEVEKQRVKAAGWVSRTIQLLQSHCPPSVAPIPRTTTPSTDGTALQEQQPSTTATTDEFNHVLPQSLHLHARSKTRIRNTRDVNGLWSKGPALKREFHDMLAVNRYLECLPEIPYLAYTGSEHVEETIQACKKLGKVQDVQQGKEYALHVRVCNQEGKVTSVPLYPWETSVAHLLQKWNRTRAAPMETADCRVRLYFENQILDDEDASLEACGIHDGSLVKMQPAMFVHQEHGGEEEEHVSWSELNQS